MRKKGDDEQTLQASVKMKDRLCGSTNTSARCRVDSKMSRTHRGLRVDTMSQDLRDETTGPFVKEQETVQKERMPCRDFTKALGEHCYSLWIKL